MKNKETEKRLRMEKPDIRIDEKKKAETMAVLQKQIAEKQIGILHSRKLIIKGQIRYMDKSVIVIHTLLCMILLAAGVMMSHQGASKEEMILYSMLLSGIMGIASIVQTGRIFSSGIAELSESCYFNIKQIVAFHMVLSGIINLTFLLFSIFFVGIRWKMNLLQTGLYLLVPFVMTQCCCLRVLLTEAGRKNTYLLVMAGMFSIIFYLIIASIPELYRITALAVWCTAFIIGLLLLGVQVKILFKGMERGDMICTN